MPHAMVSDYPVVVDVPVVWGEMDSYRHVNNVVYFRYLESARIEYFRRLEWFEFEKETGIGPILQSTSARFRRALTYPDTISVSARIILVENDRFTIEHRIVSHVQNELATEGQGTVVTYDYRQAKKVPMPDEIRRRIEKLEGKTFS